MPWILGFLGALFGAFLADFDRIVFGLLGGAVVGALLGAQVSLRTRLAAIERRLANVAAAERRASLATAAAPSAAPSNPPMPETPTEAAPPAAPAAPTPAPAAAASPAVSAPPPRPAAPPLAAAREMQEARGPKRPEPTAPTGPSLDERITGTLRRWLFEGNLPVKFGLVVLFFGIAAALKYAVDEGYFNAPIEYRFLGVAAVALGFLAWGWAQRQARPVFGLSLQGGAIGVLLLTVFSAFRLYDLIDAASAFGLVLVLVAGGALLAVLQNAVALAVLAFVGGYLAPVLISTGSGDHVALFSYYAVLNLAVLAIAWFRPWRALNLVGFAFTFAIGTAWGAKYYRPELFASVEPFLVGFFLFYVAIPVLYALRTREARRGFVDGTLVFGTPLLAFPLQAALLGDDRFGLAYSALGAALLYAALAFALIRREGLRLLALSFATLAVGFATVAVPLALSSRWTSSVWALQGAALVWLGLRQQRLLPKLTGWLLQGLAGLAWLWGVFDGGWNVQADELPLLNGHALSVLCLALGAFAVSRLHESAGGTRAVVWPPFLLGLFWWVVAGLREIDAHASGWREDAPWIAFVAATLATAAALRGLLSWPRLGWPAVLALVASVPLALGSVVEASGGPLAAPAGELWGVWLLAAAFALWQLRAPLQRGTSWAHLAALFAIAFVLGGQFWAGTRQSLDDAWSHAAAVLPLLVLAWAAWRRPQVFGWPLQDRFPDYAIRLAGIALGVLGLWWVTSLGAAGTAAPLPFVPVLNPLELMQLLVLLFLWAMLREQRATPVLHVVLPALGFVWLTVATLRAVHQLDGAPWSPAILDSRVAQTALTVVWSIAGVSAWVLGSRRRSRGVWTAGAVLMVLVLAKLVLVDRSYIGNLPGIVSFLAVGGLLVAVGWLAPSPPRRESEVS
jgi:uncharacterized membrane protein